MPKIRNADITDGSISFTKVGNLIITTTVQYLQSGNSAVTQYALGLSTAFTTSAPLQIKESGNTSTTGWSEEQDISIYGVSLTTVIPWFDGSPGAVVPTTGTGTITSGDLVGIYGAGSWSAGSNLTVSRKNAASAGSQNAAIVTGGLNQANQAEINTELFNGSTWSASGNLILSRYTAAGAGSQNSAIVAGGANAAASAVSSTELFNGSTWFTSGNLNFTRTEVTGTGSQSAAIVAGGLSATTWTELFNGSTWSVSGNLNAARSGAASAGSQNSTVVIGGTGSESGTALFNGSAWSASGNLTISRYYATGAGSQNAAIAAGGNDGANTLGSTELHNQILYRKLTYNNFREAKNIGIAADVNGTSLNVKIVGYMNNIAITSGNAAITAGADSWAAAAGYYAVLSRFSPNVNTTNNPTSIIIKSSVEADDYLVGQVISKTEMIVFNSNVFTKDNIGNW